MLGRGQQRAARKAQGLSNTRLLARVFGMTADLKEGKIDPPRARGRSIATLVTIDNEERHKSREGTTD